MSDQKKEIGALWLKNSKKGMQFYSGTINGQKVVGFIQVEKRNPNAPDIKLYPSEPMAGQHEQKQENIPDPWA